MILQVVFTVDNGAGPYTATFTPPDGHNLCDGRWHRIDGLIHIRLLKHMVYQI